MKAIRVITENEYLQAQLLIQFMDVCSRGLVRPYDPEIYHAKLMKIKNAGGDIGYLQQCCPPGVEVRDVLDLKDHILASAERVAEIFDIFNQER